MKKLLSVALLLIPSVAFANPSVSSVSGTAAYGATMDIIGAGYGTKPNQQKTECYANFEDASASNGGVACSSWSAVTTMGDVNNVLRKTTGCLDGNGCVGIGAIDIGLNKNNTANVSISDVGVGGKIYWGWDWDWTGGGGTYPSSTVNWKTFRSWPPSVGTQNDIYGGQNIDSSFIYDTESEFNTTVGVDKVWSTPLRPPIGAWQQVCMYNQLNSNASTSQTDGRWRTVADGIQMMNITTWRSNTATYAANGRYQTMYPIHMVMANGSFPSGGDFRYDNVIIETSYCVVWLSTVSTNMETARRNYMVVQTWADGEITAVFAQNSFTPGSTVYLYVQENGGTINASGFPITVAATSGGGGPPPLQPTEANQFCPCLP